MYMQTWSMLVGLLTRRPKRTDWLAFTVSPQTNSRKGREEGAFCAYSFVKEKGWLQSCERVEVEFVLVCQLDLLLSDLKCNRARKRDR